MNNQIEFKANKYKHKRKYKYVGPLSIYWSIKTNELFLYQGLKLYIMDEYGAESINIDDRLDIKRVLDNRDIFELVEIISDQMLISMPKLKQRSPNVSPLYTNSV